MSNPVPLEPGKYYHIFNRGNNREDIFREERNYRYFLQLYAKHVEAVAATFAYCLLRNHFHFAVRIKEREHLTGLGDLSGVVADKPSQAFSNFFNAYARAYNKTYQRTGALFQRPLGRIEVTSEAYFSTLIAYIHENPQKHAFVADFREWPWSSYHALLSTKSTHLRRDEVLAWFGGAQELQEAHRREIDSSWVQALAPDDFD